MSADKRDEYQRRLAEVDSRSPAPPRYDLGLLATAVMGAEAREVEAAPESGAARSDSPVLVTPRMFWIGLGAAVVVLLAVIAKLVGSSAAPSPRSPPSP